MTLQIIKIQMRDFIVFNKSDIFELKIQNQYLINGI